MKSFTIALIVALFAPVGLAQTSLPNPTRQASDTVKAPSVEPEEALPRFDLDFRGGTPRELVNAIEKSSGKPLNAIVPSEHADVRIPPLKLHSVDVAQLFQALELASRTTVAYSSGSVDFGPGQMQRRQIQQATSAFGFRTQGPVRENSVWYFYHEKPALPPDEANTVRFWQLEPFLEHYEVDAITSAIETGYKLLGERAPAIRFHKETKLLIAVGESSKLNLIDSALRELSGAPAPRTAAPRR